MPASSARELIRDTEARIASSVAPVRHVACVLDDDFRRHAIANDAAGVSRAYVLARTDDNQAAVPILGFYTLSMGLVASADVAAQVTGRLPKYPLPVALIGRLAVDQRAQGRRVGERLLIDAMRRILDAAELIGCLGIVVDAKDDGAASFYANYDFVAPSDEGWPRRMFIALVTVRAALDDEPSSRGPE